MMSDTENTRTNAAAANDDDDNDNNKEADAFLSKLSVLSNGRERINNKTILLFC